MIYLEQVKREVKKLNLIKKKGGDKMNWTKKSDGVYSYKNWLLTINGKKWTLIDNTAGKLYNSSEYDYPLDVILGCYKFSQILNDMNMSAKEFSILYGVNYNTVYRWEAERTQIPDYLLRLLMMLEEQ